MRVVCNLALSLGLILVSGVVVGHHVVANDIDKADRRILDGTVDRVEWINPHVVLHLNVEQPSGFSRMWLLQLDTPNSLLRKGINRRALENGLSLSLVVYPSLSNPCSNDCFGYALELNNMTGRPLILNQGLADSLSELPSI